MFGGAIPKITRTDSKSDNTPPSPVTGLRKAVSGASRTCWPCINNGPVACNQHPGHCFLKFPDHHVLRKEQPSMQIYFHQSDCLVWEG